MIGNKETIIKLMNNVVWVEVVKHLVIRTYDGGNFHYSVITKESVETVSTAPRRKVAMTWYPRRTATFTGLG
jgi:hypothetical protein